MHKRDPQFFGSPQGIVGDICFAALSQEDYSDLSYEDYRNIQVAWSLLE